LKVYLKNPGTIPNSIHRNKTKVELTKEQSAVVEYVLTHETDKQLIFIFNYWGEYQRYKNSIVPFYETFDKYIQIYQPKHQKQIQVKALVVAGDYSEQREKMLYYKYEGALVNGKYNGYAKLEEFGKTYNGYFVDNLRHG
jgi:hypothetical protein